MQSKHITLGRAQPRPTSLAALSLLSLASLLGTSANVHAGDKPFTHVYLAETLPKGAKEIEQWVTQRNARSQGKYSLTQTRTEFEYGVTDKWTIALYANAYAVNAKNNNSIASRNNYTVVGDGDEVSGGGPVTAGAYVPHADFFPLPSAHYQKQGFDSFSIESIYQFLSPYKDAIGVAGYVELSSGKQEQELELKLLLQKNLLDDDLIIAGNMAFEFERDKWSGLGVEKESKLKLSAGASYRLAPSWRAGWEIRNERSWEGGYQFKSSQRDSSAWYTGPTIHYANKNYFVTLSYQQQLKMANAYSIAAKDELVDSRIYKGHERHGVRLIGGVSF